MKMKKLNTREQIEDKKTVEEEKWKVVKIKESTQQDLKLLALKKGVKMQTLAEQAVTELLQRNGLE
ncbi:hypothetical protein B795N_14930 [Marinilactibacillus psychrotolerans]|uniref:hypothetical protein n=1 Tax=Marinilactibacillus psychrotolerans TaxID=191770 RepID=UPI001C7DEF8C|nr:hypothetical protein [Marinilactibacillus psychrotolerans]GEQ33611.1 hypothetical protein B795N_14930 [Marinilactibacillus psychrotolerans]